MFFRRKSSQPTEVDERLAFEYAKLSVVEFGAWIKNADTKATVLAAGLGVMSSIVATQAPIVVQALRQENAGVVPGLVVVAASAFLVALVVAVVCVYRVLSPRVGVSGGKNAFAWPSVASFSSGEDENFSKANSSVAWAQAYDLALIAKAKFSWFALALKWFLAAVALAIVLVSLVRIVTGV